MEILKRLSDTIDYIERHIENTIDYDDIAMLVHCSPYNFHRMFTFICGISVSEYVRRRRLTLAALELAEGHTKVIDVALKYGYDSPVSFSRAFKAMHGISPSMVSKSKTQLKAFPKMTFQIKIKGDVEMDYRIEQNKEMSFFGYEALISTTGDNNHYNHPGLFWNEIHEKGLYDQLLEATGYKEHPEFKTLCNIHAIMNYKDTPAHSYAYMIGALLSDKSNVKDCSVIKIPATTYAVFPSKPFKWEHIGTVISEMNERIYNEWLPTTDYEKMNGAEFEIYGGTEDEGYIELWIPIEKL